VQQDYGDLDTGPGRRRDRAAIGALTVAVGALAWAFTLQTGTLVSLMPLQRYYPMLLQAEDDSRRVVRVEPVFDVLGAREVATEGWIREFLRYRHELVPSEAEQLRRADWLASRLSDRLWREFQAASEANWTLALQDGLVRTVSTGRAALQARADRIREGEAIPREFWIVPFTITFAGQTTSWVGEIELTYRIVDLARERIDAFAAAGAAGAPFAEPNWFGLTILSYSARPPTAQELQR
jgi:hypothetical protein